MIKYRTLLLLGVVLAIVFSGIVMWNLLAPGYMFALDTVFGPQSGKLGLEKFLQQGSVFGLITYIATHFMPVWVYQKIFLCTLLVLLFLIPYLAFIRIARLVFGEASKVFHIEHAGAVVSATVLYAINPFVYERFISGQWLLIAGYLFLPYLLSFALDPYKLERGQDLKVSNLKNMYFEVVPVVILLLLISICSLHILCFAFVLYLVARAVRISKQSLKSVLLEIVAVLTTFIAVSSWYLSIAVKFVYQFSSNQLEPTGVFTAVRPAIEQVWNLLTLQSFWLLHSDWSKGFVIPQRDLFTSFALGGTGVFIVSIVGVYCGLKKYRSRYNKLLVYASVLVLLVGLMCGTFWQQFFAMFEGSSLATVLLAAFRDSGKWSALLMVAYSVFYMLGTYSILKKIQRLSLAFVFVCLPLLITPSLFFGASGGVSLGWYSDSWQKVGEFYEDGCKILVLPWHQYYSQSFIEYKLTANPAKHILKCDSVVSADAGIAGGNRNSIEDFKVDHITRYMQGVSGETENQFIEWLKGASFTQVLFSMDVIGEDPYRYSFLRYLRPSSVYSYPIDRSVLIFEL